MESIFTPALLLSPSVKNLTVYTDWIYPDNHVRQSVPPTDITSQEWISLADRVADIAPQISSFKVRALNEDLIEDGVVDHWSGKVPALLDAFGRFSPSSLCKLDITPLVLTHSALTSIGRLEGLRSLNLSLFDFLHDELSSLQPLFLPSLEQLSIDTNSLFPSRAFLHVLHTSQLKSLTLSCFFEIDTNPASFFLTLRTCERYHSTLQKIRVRKVETGRIRDKALWDELAEPRFVVTRSTAQALLPFSRLESLSIGPCKPLQLQDHDLDAMLSAWPRLKVLELDDETLAVDYCAPLLTFEGVHKALQSVPLLECLTLSFDGSTFSPSDIDSLTPPHQRLAVWNVCSSSIARPLTFASWIATNYPSLKKIEYFKMYLEGMKSAYLGSPWMNAAVLRQAKYFIDQFAKAAVMVDRWASVRGCLLAKEQEK
jgi:hypothetical protein